MSLFGIVYERKVSDAWQELAFALRTVEAAFERAAEYQAKVLEPRRYGVYDAEYERVRAIDSVNREASGVRHQVVRAEKARDVFVAMYGREHAESVKAIRAANRVLGMGEGLYRKAQEAAAHFAAMYDEPMADLRSRRWDLDGGTE